MATTMMATTMRTLLLLLSALVTGTHALNQPVEFKSITPYRRTTLAFKEDTTINSRIAEVKAEDPESGSTFVRYAVDSSTFKIGITSGWVTLNHHLDYERNRRAILVVKAYVVEDPEDTQTASVTYTVTVLDINDNTPSFTKQVYNQHISEAALINSVVLKDIKVTDLEHGNVVVSVVCDASEEKIEFKGVCDTFSVVQTSIRSDQTWIGHIVLSKKLSYAELNVWQIPLRASDGVNSVLKSVEIIVTDFQDQPPRFVGSMSHVIDEGIKRGENITADPVNAIDPDRGAPRNIVYELVSNPGGLFAIGNESGIMTVAVAELDRDRDSTLVDGFVNVEIKAREVIVASDGSKFLGDDPTSTSVGTMLIVVRDINDNKPIWVPTEHVTHINEEISNKANVKNSSFHVHDHDQSINSIFQIELLNFTDIFDVFPTDVQQLGSVTIRIKNNSLIDYESDVKQYVLHIVAKETQTTEKNSNTATVTIHVEDVNDNEPVFAKQEYLAEDVSEKAVGGTPVPIGALATDSDSGKFGTAGLRYRLIGAGSKFFNIDPITGAITVKECETPGEEPCLDFEDEQSYELAIRADDDLNSQHSNRNAALLEITIRDENDNKPKFRHDRYEFYIRETQTSTVPSMRVRADDRDSTRNGNNVLRYELEDKFGGLWRIGTSSGVISATSPVDYESTPDKKGVYNLVVKASDSTAPYNEDICNVTIRVIDMNDNRPLFVLEGDVSRTISETTKPNTHIVTLNATDGDLSTQPSGTLHYIIRSGGQDKFVIDSKTGDLSTSAIASFNYDDQSSFQLIVVAQDEGSPSQLRSTELTILLTDVNNRDPYFLSNPIRKEVKENETVGFEIIKMHARDVDSDSELEYKILSTELIGPAGTTVTLPNEPFALNKTTGWVTVANKLSRDKLMEVRLKIQAEDLKKVVGVQKTEALLIIEILDVNENPPEFSSPWTVANPVYNITIDEEQALGSMVMVMTATDTDGVISEYRMIEDADNLFAITPSGMVTSKSRIDYEKINKTSFVVIATDAGIPILTATATVLVSIKNLNDESPFDTNTTYSITFDEISGKRPAGPYPDKQLKEIRATDTDAGDYGVVSYELVDKSDRFYLKPKGDAVELFLNGSSILDRETTPDVVLQLIAYDSPSDTSISRNTTIPLYIRLLDLNDNDPRFLVNNYFATVLDTANINTEVLRVSATDPDLDQTQSYAIVGVTPFGINSTSGQIVTTGSLKGASSPITFRVSVTDNAPEKHIAHCTVTITLIQASRQPPLFQFPSSDKEVITVLEEQYKGLIITRIRAKAINDSLILPSLTYGFYNNKGVFTDHTDEFQLNPITGVLTAKIVFNREVIDKYTLELAVRDDSKPPLETRMYTTVVITDVDDHQPSFPLDQDGKPRPYRFVVPEHAEVGVQVGFVRAVDADIGDTSVVYYRFVSGNDLNVFSINSTSGVIFTARALNRETAGTYTLQIEATNIQPAAGSRKRRAVGTKSVVSVVISVEDINDNQPVFQHSEYKACVSSNSLLGDKVITATAIDPDASSKVVYSIGDVISVKRKSTSIGRTFAIDSNGEITLARLISNVANDKLSTELTATDANAVTNKDAPVGKAQLLVWVTADDNMAKLTVTESPQWVEQYMKNYKREIQLSTKAGFVCVNQVRYHIDKFGNVDTTKTDLMIAAVDEQGSLKAGKDVSSALSSSIKGEAKDQFAVLGAAQVGTFEDEISHDDTTMSMVFMIVLLLVIVLGALLFVGICYCMKRKYDREIDNLQPVTYDVLPLEKSAIFKTVPLQDSHAALY